MQSVVGQGLRGNGNHARSGAADAGYTFLVGGMFTVRLGDNQDAHGAVSLRVLHLYTRGGVASVAGAVEDRLGIGLLGLVIEDQDDFAVRIEGLVIVVTELGRGDSETGKYDGRGYVDVFREGAISIGKFPLLFVRAAFERDIAFGTIVAEFSERNRLEIAAIYRGFQAGFGELRGDPLNRCVIAGLQ